MRRVIFLLSVLAIGLVLTSCGVLRHLNLDVPKSVPRKPGKVNFYHWNQGVYGHAVLFKGYLNKREMFTINPETGSLMWANPIVDSFVFNPAKSRNWPRINYLHLVPNANYTLYIFWTRFNGREVKGKPIVHFRTGLYSGDDCRTSNLGRVTCASVIIDLPRVDGSAPGRFTFHKTLYVGDWMKALFGLP